jgi:ATP/maltotriose-dependent transcriptional regulator MalT
MHSTAPLRPHIRADKFYPPRVDAPQFLRRDRILEQLRRRAGSRLPTLLFEAQAGQGKTTVIKQYLDQVQSASVWFQVGPEDTNPAFFLQAIPVCIRGVLPGYPSDATAQILTGGDFAGFDLHKQLDLLLADLRSCLKEDLYLVFDDLHELIPYPSSLAVLKHLLEHAPVNLHFILKPRAKTWRAILRKVAARNVLILAKIS